MPSCAVVICKNRSATTTYKTHGITYHLFPHDKERKKLWIEATGRSPDYWPSNGSTICSQHFEEKFFQPLKKCRRLFDWAIPTLKLRQMFVPVAQENSTFSSTSKEPAIDEDRKDDQNNEVSQKNSNFSSASKEPTIDEDRKEDQNNEDQKEANFSIGIEDTPRKQKLRLHIEKCESKMKQQKKHIQRLQKKASRYRKKIAKLNDILRELQEKNLVNSDQVTQLIN